MRIPVPAHQEAVATSTATSHGSVSSQGVLSPQADTGNTFPVNVAQNLTPPSMGPQHQPHSRSCPPFPVQPNTTHVGHRGVNGIQIQTHSSIPIPYSRMPHIPPAATTMPWWSGPPPLQFNKSPYCRVPLPEMTQGPVNLNPILAYSRERPNELNVSQGQAIDVRHHHHICAPATNPSLRSLTLLLPNDLGIITVHASFRGHSFVTVGDVLDALDTAFFGRSSTEVSPLVEGMHGDQCACQNTTTALQSLRSQYEQAGLMRSEEGFDIWDLRIG